MDSLNAIDTGGDVVLSLKNQLFCRKKRMILRQLISRSSLIRSDDEILACRLHYLFRHHLDLIRD
jgi:hypothetical protein